MKDEKQMYENLKGFITKLVSENKDLLLKEGADRTASSCTFFAMMNRFIGTSGDAKVPSSCPQLRQETDEEIKAAVAWFDKIYAAHPIVTRGKRDPIAEAAAEERKNSKNKGASGKCGKRNSENKPQTKSNM